MENTPVPLIAVIALAVTPLLATSSIPADFTEIVADATVVVRGRVTDVRPVIVRDAGVESTVTVAVDAVLKGPATDFVSVRVPGGEIGRYRYEMIGAPRFQPGQQAVFFLRSGTDNLLRPVGLAMGVYRITAEPLSGRPMVAPPVVASRTASVGPVVRGDPRRRAMTLQEFESLVRLVIASRPRQSAGGGR